MITKNRAKSLVFKNSRNYGPAPLKSFKSFYHFKPGLLMSLLVLIVLISGCSFADTLNISSVFTPEPSLTLEPTVNPTLFVPQFDDPSTPSPMVLLDTEKTIRPSWTPGKPTARLTWTPTQPLPTRTLRPTWTATITPTPTNTPEIGLLISEDFSDQNNPHWIQKSGSNWATWIFNGKYFMQIKAPYVEISAGPYWLKTDEVAFEADLT
ncbi:MAG: hypothetical protein ABFS03_11905, partial [Chloroflexota bacterium]